MLFDWLKQTVRDAILAGINEAFQKAREQHSRPDADSELLIDVSADRVPAVRKGVNGRK